MKLSSGEEELMDMILTISGVSPEWHGIKHFLNSVSDVGLVERHSDVW